MIKWEKKSKWWKTNSLLNFTVGRTEAKTRPCWGGQARTPRWTQTGAGGKTEVRDDDKRAEVADCEIIKDHQGIGAEEEMDLYLVNRDLCLSLTLEIEFCCLAISAWR